MSQGGGDGRAEGKGANKVGPPSLVPEVRAPGRF